MMPALSQPRLDVSCMLVRCYRRVRSCCGSFPYPSTARTHARSRGLGLYQILSVPGGDVLETGEVIACPDQTSGVMWIPKGGKA